MKQLYSDLWQTNLYSTGTLNTHAYFLKTDKGNALIYNSANKNDLDEIETLGGIDFQFLSHRDEIGSNLPRIRERFNSKLVCDEKEAHIVSKVCTPDILISEEQIFNNGIKAFHTPGHSIGSCSFWYKSPNGMKYIFTGDCFFPWNGKLSTFIIKSFGGNRDDMKNSLELYKKYNPNIVLCSASIGNVSIVEVNDEEWINELNRNIQKLQT